MAVNDGHMVDHTASFGQSLSGLRARFGATVTAAVGEPSSGGGGRPPTLGDLNPPIEIPTIPGSFGRPRPKPTKKYKA